MQNDGKLRVPAPGDPEEPESPYDSSIVVAATVSILVGLAIFLARYPDAPPPGASSHSDVDSSEAGREVPTNAVAARLRDLEDENSLKELAERDWSAAEQASAFGHGPEKVARAVCRASADELASGELDGKAAAALVSAADRRESHVPWACLLRLYLEDRLSKDLQVYDEVEAVWNKLRAFEASKALVDRLLRVWGEEGAFPDSPRFERWLRLCALNFEVGEGQVCRRTLAELAADSQQKQKYGADLLDVVETHLRETELNPNYDLPILIAALERLAERGQSDGWRVVETEELPDYDVDLRIAAGFYLCRMVNSPNDDVAGRAAESLSEAAGVAVRAVNEGLRTRWLEACKRAFRTGGTEEQPDAPALAVWNGEPDSEPRYELEFAVENGLCEVREGHPRWYCASLMWQGGGPEDLLDFFVSTRHVEWE